MISTTTTTLVLPLFNSLFKLLYEIIFIVTQISHYKKKNIQFIPEAFPNI